MFFWKTPTGAPSMILTTQVDDIAIAADPLAIDNMHRKFQVQFDKVPRQGMPFVHCGCRYNKMTQGYSVDQTEFAENLKTVQIKENDKDDRTLVKEEVTSFRSILGGLLWLTATRVDLIADVCQLQTFVTQAKVKRLRMANSIVKKAQDKKMISLGIIFRFFKRSDKLRIACIHDASAASKERNYANEGILVLLTTDNLDLDPRVHNIDGENSNPGIFGGPAHILWSQGNKAKRISYSTSHGETLAAINGLESATLVALRLGEILIAEPAPSLQQLASLQERGAPFLPVDVYTDCNDFFELSTGSKSLPQDKGQRIYILARREARLVGRIRWIVLIRFPTESMTADALTKSMISPCLLHLQSTGIVRFANTGTHVIKARRLPVLDQEIIETDLLEGDSRFISPSASSTSFRASPHTMFMLFVFGNLMLVTSSTVNEEPEGSNMFFYGLVGSTAVIAILLWKFLVIVIGSLGNAMSSLMGQKNQAEKDTTTLTTTTASMAAALQEKINELTEALKDQEEETEQCAPHDDPRDQGP